MNFPKLNFNTIRMKFTLTILFLIVVSNCALVSIAYFKSKASMSNQFKKLWELFQAMLQIVFMMRTKKSFT